MAKNPTAVAVAIVGVVGTLAVYIVGVPCPRKATARGVVCADVAPVMVGMDEVGVMTASETLSQQRESVKELHNAVVTERPRLAVLATQGDFYVVREPAVVAEMLKHENPAPVRKGG